MSQKFKHIERNKNVSWNQPILLGKRLTVKIIVNKLKLKT